MSTTKPSLLQVEPITVTEAFKALLLTTLGLLQAFNLINLTDTQTAVILAEYVALSVALSAFARSRVTPDARVALTTTQADLITEAQTLTEGT